MSYDPTQPIGAGNSDPTLPMEGGRSSGRTGTIQPPEGTNRGPFPPRDASVGQGQAAIYGVYAARGTRRSSLWAVASLVLGIASYLGLPLVGGIAAVICGHVALGEIKRSEGQMEGRGLAVIGLVLGYAHFVLVLCIAALVVAIFAAGLTIFGISR